MKIIAMIDTVISSQTLNYTLSPGLGIAILSTSRDWRQPGALAGGTLMQKAIRRSAII